MADNPVEHSRTKHIAIRYHFLRDHQQKGDIKISYINTKDQLADIFTKPLDEQTFNKLRHELNILDSRNFFWCLAHIAHKYTFDHVSFIYAMTNVFSSEFQTKS
jgi:transcription initiation factor IIE alpha subunit